MAINFDFGIRRFGERGSTYASFVVSGTRVALRASTSAYAAIAWGLETVAALVIAESRKRARKVNILASTLWGSRANVGYIKQVLTSCSSVELAKWVGMRSY